MAPIMNVDTIGESFGIDSKESAQPHTGSLTLPTVATIQASTSHVYFQTNLFRGIQPLLNGQLNLGGVNITLELDFLSGKRIK